MHRKPHHVQQLDGSTKVTAFFNSWKNLRYALKQVMAEALLSAWHAPSLISSVGNADSYSIGR